MPRSAGSERANLATLRFETLPKGADRIGRDQLRRGRRNPLGFSLSPLQAAYVPTKARATIHGALQTAMSLIDLRR
jgi:hypothetical protein